MAPHLRLLTLGPPLLMSAEGGAVRFRTRKHLALLMRLALEPGKRQSRDYLINLLWPEASQERGRHSLAQAITILRGVVGREHVSAKRATVELLPDVVDVDVLHLGDCDVEIRGPFLETFDVGAPGFEQWKDGWAARLYPQIRDCLVAKMNAARRIADFSTVEQNALLLAALDPHSEDAVRSIMEARHWVGDRSNAIKVFRRFETRIREDLDAEPSSDLRRLALLLREGRRPFPRPRSEEVDPPGPEAWRFDPEPLVGREREFSVLYDAWLEARAHKPCVVVITGDPGIGKTTLANAFVSTCQVEGAVVARAQAYEAERELPFAILAELLRQLAAQKAIGESDPDDLAELTRVTPEIVAHFPGVGKPAEMAPEITPLRIANAFLRVITISAEDSPVILVVDDIHSADNASIAILHLVARKMERQRMMMMLTARLGEMRAMPEVATLTTDAHLLRRSTLRLDPLDDTAARLLTERLISKARARPDLTADVVRVASGNPLAIELLVQESIGQSGAALIESLSALDTSPPNTIKIPGPIQSAFDRQTDRLGEKTKMVLFAAAVLGRRIADLDLYSLFGCPSREAIGHLSSLLDAGLLREIRGELEFKNELVRALSYYLVPTALRQRMHRHVGQHLMSAAQTSHRQKEARAQLEIAWHFLRGNDPTTALSFVLEGVERSIAAGAPMEAQQALQKILYHQFEESAETRLKALLTQAFLDQSKARQALAISDELLRRHKLDSRDRAKTLLSKAQAEYLMNRNNGEDYLRAAPAALVAARDTGDADLIVRSLFEVARAGVETGNREFIDLSAHELHEVIKDPLFMDLPAAHYALSYCETCLHNPAAALPSIQTAIELWTPSGSPAQLSQAYSGLGVVRFHLCDMLGARVAFERGLDIALKIGDESRGSTLMGNLVTTLAMMGDYEKAIETGRNALKLADRSMQPVYAAACTNLIDPLVLTGRESEARECLVLAANWAAQERSFLTRLTVLYESASFHMVAGSKGLALESIVEIEREIQGRRGALSQPGVLTKLLCYKAINTEGVEEAQTIASSAEAFNVRSYPYAYLDVLAAKLMVERAKGRLEAARELEAELLSLLAEFRMPGKRAQLAAQGFLPAMP